MKILQLILTLFIIIQIDQDQKMENKTVEGRIKFIDRVAYVTEFSPNSTYGEKVEYTFKFVNTGSEPIKVISVKPSCTCTSPDFTSQSINRLDTGFVKLSTTYDQLKALGSVNAVVLSDSYEKYSNIILKFSRN